MLILGYDSYVFDAAACLVQDGVLVAAAQEERFTRRKSTGEFPERSIRYCLDHVGADLSDVDHVGFYFKPFHQLHRRAAQIAGTLPGSLRYWNSHSGQWWSMVRAKSELCRRLTPAGAPRSRFRFHGVRHHLAHASSAFFVSPFDRAAILTLDGSGEIVSTTIGAGEGKRIEILREIPYPHSIGYAYSSLTHYLGFRPNRGEYQVMALAAYGGPSRYYDDFLEIIRLIPGGGYEFDLRYFNYPMGKRDPWVSARFIDRFGPIRRPDDPVQERHQLIAWALQRRIEDVALHMAREAHRRTGARNLVLVGGCALNSVMNERLRRDGPFEKVWAPPAPDDAGTGIGAAYWIHHSVLGHPRCFTFDSPYLGPEYGAPACLEALREAGLSAERLGEEALVRRTVDNLEKDRVVGWFQGRMELGPRALGNRSILADPRRASMRDRINAKIKHRQGFRPFAPAVIEEAVGDFFADGRSLPYMLFVLPVRPERRSVIPAVVHVDGTARVQTVSRRTNPLFHRLISEFGRRTGVPVLLNTSFNDAGEPIVCSPSEAIRCFRGTGLDALVLGPYFVERSPG